MRVESAEGIRVNQVVGGAPGLRVTGLQLVDGTLRITGRLEGNGTIIWQGTIDLQGPWKLTGNGQITGNVDITGILKLMSDLIVENNGRVLVGNMVIDPTEGGSIALPGGAKVQADPNGGVRMIQGDNRAYVGPTLVSLQYGADKSIALSNSGITVRGAPVSENGTGLSWVGMDPTSKQLYEVRSNTGGPHGRLLMWPFPPNTVTDEFGPREPGDSGSAFHQGIDFGTGGVTTGSPIPAAAAGTVILAGDNGGYGNCVIIDHGGSPNLKTLYAHMDTAPLVSVGQVVNKGQILGPVGNTGQSFGAHLHFEVHVDGVPVNPRSKLPQQV